MKRRDLERKAEIDTLTAQKESKLRVLRSEEETQLKTQELANKAELLAIEVANKEKALRLEQGLLAVEQEVQMRRFAVESEQSEHRAKLGAVDDSLTRRRTETANLESPTLALVKNLPATMGGLKIHELNIGDDTLRRLAAGISGLIAQRAA